MRLRVSQMLLAGLAGISLAAAGSAQDRARPLDDLLDSLPAGEAEASPGKPDGKPAGQPFAPLLRPPPPGRTLPAPPPPEPGRIGTTELPPSAVLYPEDVAPAPSAGAAELPAPVAIAPPPPPTEADLAWQALQEQRRQEINAREAPLVAELNARMAADQEAARLRAEEARAEHERALLDRETEIARIEADHQAAVEAHRRAVLRQQAEYDARVAACLAGDRAACAPR